MNVRRRVEEHAGDPIVDKSDVPADLRRGPLILPRCMLGDFGGHFAKPRHERLVRGVEIREERRGAIGRPGHDDLR